VFEKKRTKPNKDVKRVAEDTYLGISRCDGATNVPRKMQRIESSQELRPMRQFSLRSLPDWQSGPEKTTENVSICSNLICVRSVRNAWTHYYRCIKFLNGENITKLETRKFQWITSTMPYCISSIIYIYYIVIAPDCVTFCLYKSITKIVVCCPKITTCERESGTETEGGRGLTWNIPN